MRQKLILVLFASAALCVMSAASEATALVQYIAYPDPRIVDAYISQPGNQYWVSNGMPWLYCGGVNDNGTLAWENCTLGVNAYSGYQVIVTAADAAEGNAYGWKLSAYLRMPTRSEPIDNFGGIVGYIDGVKKWDIAFGTDADGDPVVGLVNFPGGLTTFALEGAGRMDYHLYELIYDPATATADLFVDGTERLSNWAGAPFQAVEKRVRWGDWDDGAGYESHIRYNLVQWETFSHTPEPATIALMGLGLGVTVLFRRGRRFFHYLLPVLLALSLTGAADAIEVTVQHRDADGNPYTQVDTIDPSKTCIAVIDMWNSCPDHVMKSRVCILIDRMNDTLAVARELGMPVVFFPACWDAYASHPRRQAFMAMPYHPLPSSRGLTWPEEPYAGNLYGTMYPQGVSPTPFPWQDAQHPDVPILDTDFIGPSNELYDDRQLFWNFMAENGIDTIIYTGCAANMCMVDRSIGVRAMRNLEGVNTYVIPDISDSFTGNGYNGDTGLYDLAVSPDKGHRESIDHLETHYNGNLCLAPSIVGASEILAYAADNRFAYTVRIAGERGLVSYLRLDGKSEYKHTADICRVQSAWNTENLTMGVAGAIYGDDDTAAKFDGTAAAIMSPRFRANLRSGSELTSVSLNDFTVEAWVQVDALGNRMWALAHDRNDELLDFALGLTEDGHFRFMSRNLANDINTIGTLTVTADDVANNAWFHVVGVQDATKGAFELYVNGRRVAFKNSVDGVGEAVLNALTIGCRSGVFDIDDSEAGEGATGAVLSGGIEFWHGVIDEVAIYNVALEGNEIFEHYKIGTTGVLVSPLAGDTDLDGDVDFADYQNLESRYLVGARWCDGDFNGDDLVTFADYQMLEQNFGQSLGGSPTPEPATIGLMAFGTLATLLLGRRRK